MEFFLLGAAVLGVGAHLRGQVQNNPLDDPAHRREVERIRERAQRELERVDYQHRQSMAELNTKKAVVEKEIGMLQAAKYQIDRNVKFDVPLDEYSV